MSRDRGAASVGSVPVVSRAARRVRAGIVAVVTVLLAVAAHVIGDGMAPSVAVLLPTVVAVSWVAHRLSARRIDRWQLVLLLAGAQLIVHLLASVTAMPGHAAAVNPGLMLVAHAVSTLLTAAILASAERIWWLARSWLQRHWPTRYQPTVASRRRAWLPAVGVPPAVAQWLGAGTIGMRAPPQLA